MKVVYIALGNIKREKIFLKNKKKVKEITYRKKNGLNHQSEVISALGLYNQLIQRSFKYTRNNPQEQFL